MRSVPGTLTPDDYTRARRLLMRRDPVLGKAIKQIGPCLLAERQRKDHLTALVAAIVSQQLSTKAAATIFGRLAALFPGNVIPGHQAIAAIEDQTLRSVGLSSQKVSYLRDLCARLSDGRLVLDELDVLEDEEVIARLVAVKGFGRWTAEMFLMFRLHRPDVLPVGDLGIEKTSRPETVDETWRTVAALSVSGVLVSLAKPSDGHLTIPGSWFFVLGSGSWCNSSSSNLEPEPRT
jgi:DNA-3-methyladenine glycosylase II